MNPDKSDYTAKSIKVIDETEIREKFPWYRVEILAEEYHRPVEWIQRGFETCFRCGLDVEYFISKYLKGEDVEPNPLFQETYKEVCAEYRK